LKVVGWVKGRVEKVPIRNAAPFCPPTTCHVPPKLLLNAAI